MSEGEHGGNANNSRFFRRELEEALNLDSLYLEAYILVHRVGFTYADVKSMPRLERLVYIKLLKDEVERENDAIERSKSSR